jgi:hypothetical protein
MKIEVVERRTYNVPDILADDLREALESKDTERIDELVSDLDNHDGAVESAIESVREVVKRRQVKPVRVGTPNKIETRLVKHNERADVAADLRNNGYTRIGRVESERGMTTATYRKGRRVVRVVSSYMGGAR